MYKHLKVRIISTNRHLVLYKICVEYKVYRSNNNRIIIAPTKFIYFQFQLNKVHFQWIYVRSKQSKFKYFFILVLFFNCLELTDVNLYPKLQLILLEYYKCLM